MAGIVPGDHACVSFGSDDEHQAIVARCAGEALDRGDRLLYFAHESGESTIRSYLDEIGIDVAAGLALGQIEIRPIGHTAATLDPEAVIAALQADRRAALHEGYSALAVLSEMSWVLDAHTDADTVIRYEREVDRVFAAADIVALCQYDRRLFGPELLTPLIATHEFQVCTSGRATTTARRRLTISERDDGTVELTGALDIDSSAYVGVRLAQHDAGADLVVLTSGLGFADISGCRAIVHAAERLEPGCCLLLPAAAAPLVRVMSLCGWTSHPRIVVGSSADH